MTQILKILLLEDMAEDAGLVEIELKKAGILFISKIVGDKEEFITAMEDFNPDVILSDHSLPQFNSTEALKICKEREVEIPFILVTGSVSEEFAVNTLKLGADDYILKSNLTRLPSAILNSLRKKEIENNKKSAEKALKDQNQELTKINQELDRFVYSASHDLRAPLKSVLGLVKLSQDDYNHQKFDQFQDYFMMMEKSIMKLDATIKDIINYSRNARTDVQITKIDFQVLLDNVWDDMKYVEGSENIERIININSNIDFYSDISRLTVILNNLVSNSIKYRNTDVKSFIKIKTHTTPEIVSIDIQDNGIGIDSIYIDKIFNMFYRATAKSEGSGLGLYIVKETIDKIEGKIRVKSVINEGTTFSISIPNKLSIQ